MLLTNYFLTGWRTILRHKLYSVINILGLAIGIAACLFIFLFIRYETSYDNWMPNADNIYRVNYASFYKNGNDVVSVRAPGIAKAVFEQRFPEIEEATRFYPVEPVITLHGKEFKEMSWMADRNFFKVFNLNFLEGTTGTAFNELTNIVISKKMAVKYFADQSPMGQVISLEVTDNSGHNQEKSDFEVTGVFENFPKNSEFDFEIIFPLDDNLYENNASVNGGWFNLWGFLYLRVKDGTNPNIISDQLESLVAKSVPKHDDRNVELSITNIKDTHLHSTERDGGFKPVGSIMQIYTFGVVAFLILIIACINFMNLSTARSMQRAKEVSMRKVLGANRNQLIRQFLGENIFFACVGLFLALVFVEVGLPLFNNLTDLSINIEYFNDPILLIVGLILVLIVGVFAGLYPAFYLTAFRPSEVFNGGIVNDRKEGVSLRKGLTIFQFSISITLIISTIVVYSQNQYALNKDLGFDKENKFIVRNIGRSYSKQFRLAMTEEIERLPSVKEVSLSIVVPGDSAGWHSYYKVIGSKNSELKTITQLPIDHNYFKVYEIPVLAGRNFDGTRENDIMRVELTPESDIIKEPNGGEGNQIVSIILNESAVRQLGFASPEEALEQLIESNNIEYKVIGVVPDTHFNSLRSTFQSFIYLIYPDLHFSLTVDYKESTNTIKLQQDIEGIWKRFLPDVGFTYDFVDDIVAAQYALETKQSQMLSVFSILVVIVACLGLYGLAAFTVEQRTKEIAIRKVHGANIWDVIKLLLLQFSMPVLLSNIIAWPIAWYAMSDYLESFVFRIDLGVSYFIGTGVLALIIAWITTSYHAYKAAQTNPAIVLRSS